MRRCPNCGYIELVSTHPVVASTIDDVGRVFNVTEEEILGSSRSRRVVEARHLAMSLARHGTSLTLGEIGRQIGKRDHTTTLHGIHATAKRYVRDESFRVIVAANFPAFARTLRPAMRMARALRRSA